MARNFTVEWVCDYDTSHRLTRGPDETGDPAGWLVIRVQNRTREYCPACSVKVIRTLESNAATSRE